MALYVPYPYMVEYLHLCYKPPNNEICFFTVHLLVCYISVNIPHCTNMEHINFINV